MRRTLALIALCALPSAGLGGDAIAVPDLGGRWSGYWVSDSNGHTGPLHARFTPKGDAYRVVYRGRFAKVIPFRYATTMDVVGRADGVVLLAAEKQLGPFGTFRTSATATGTAFDATFASRRDSGRFVLRRK